MNEYYFNLEKGVAIIARKAAQQRFYRDEYEIYLESESTVIKLYQDSLGFDIIEVLSTIMSKCFDFVRVEHLFEGDEYTISLLREGSECYVVVTSLQDGKALIKHKVSKKNISTWKKTLEKMSDDYPKFWDKSNNLL